MPEPTHQRLSARVRGRVQGVGYRSFVLLQARRLRLAGFVRNCPDGAVEVAAEGPEERLRQLEALLRKGPPGARVEWVDAGHGPADGSFTGFEVRY